MNDLGVVTKAGGAVVGVVMIGGVIVAAMAVHRAGFEEQSPIAAKCCAPATSYGTAARKFSPILIPTYQTVASNAAASLPRTAAVEQGNPRLAVSSDVFGAASGVGSSAHRDDRLSLIHI